MPKLKFNMYQKPSGVRWNKFLIRYLSKPEKFSRKSAKEPAHEILIFISNACSGGSDETAHMRILVRASTARMQ